MNLFKRRTRSETRNFDGPLSNSMPGMQQRSHIQLNRLGEQPTEDFELGRRKTSAEMISEVKTFLGDTSTMANTFGSHLASGGLRLVSTRRPVTPREPGRALYGKVALAGRPPSAFSMRYLQKECNRTVKTPPLEPIASKTVEQDVASSNLINRNFEIEHGAKNIIRKLPALDIRPKKEGSNKNTNTANPAANLTNMNCNVMSARKLLMRNYDLLAQSTTERLIELLKEHAGLKECTDETVAHINAASSYKAYVLTYNHSWEDWQLDYFGHRAELID